MAGILGGLGTLATTGAMMAQDKRDRAEEAQERAAADARWQQRQAEQLERLKATRNTGDTTVEPFKPTRPAPTFNGSSDSGGTTVAGAAVSDTDSTPRSLSSGGQMLSQSEMTELLVQQGMPRDQAIIGGAIGMAESGGRSDARSHPDLERDTGEMSIGLWQHNKNTGEDRHGFYGIQNWDELKDPQTNARATYRLWQRRGGWGDWGAYTNGSYAQFLPR